ncbi:hypothetical protein UlMin_014250 [Ulmus minor]
MSSFKSQHHVRSNSFPTRLHPLVQQCEEHLYRLGGSNAASSSSITDKLSGLEDLQDCVDKLLQLPLTQQAFAQGREEKWVEELLDGSLRLLDLCSAAKDAVLHTKECAREVQSILRRTRGSEVGLENEVRKYMASRKVVKKAINNALKNLKGPSNKESETILVSVLKEVQVVSLAVFESLLSFVSGPKAQSKISGWSLVSKLMQNKRIGCEEEEEAINAFAKVDNSLHCLMNETSKSSKKNVQNNLQNLESCIQDFEGRLECLFRRLIKFRVALLNILNN